MTTPPSDDLVKPDQPDRWTRLMEEIARLRASLAAMEDCKNTYVTLAYERQEQLFELRAELTEAKREVQAWFEQSQKQCDLRMQAEAARDRFAAVIAYNYLDGATRPEEFRKTIEEACECFAHHRAKEEEKNRG